jgi:phenylacetate-coenzyme A ligase PaaK-like adenylate-forming protein
MPGRQSVIHTPEAAWGLQLRERALAPPMEHDRPATLNWFRDHSPFYSDKINTNQVWETIRPIEKQDVSDIPVAPDESIRAARTSGTSGFQVTIRNNTRERYFRRALLYRPQLFYALPDDVRQVVFVDGAWCAEVATPPKLFEYGGVRYQTWFVGVAADVGRIHSLLQSLRPHLIRGISSGIVRFIDQAGESFHDLGVRYIAPGGEFLQPEWRTAMQDAFATTVLDRYGSTESGAIAWQCPFCNRYHANADEIIIEPDPDGLLVTPLFVSSQPLLRYRLGDIVSIDESVADCRIRLPTITLQQARRDDWVIGSDGKRVSPLSFQFEQVPHLDAWRLHQSSDGSLCLYFESTQPDIVAKQLGNRLADVVPNRPYKLQQGLWRLKREGKFKRVSSDLA